jgi:hypothetical protein
MVKEKNNITIYIVILLGFLILGSFYYVTKKSEQNLQLDMIQKELEADERRRAEEGLKETTELRRRDECNNEADREAASLLKSKIAVMEGLSGLSYGDRQTLQHYKEAASKGMYLKEDFETLYEKCLSRYGLKP